ncbi:MAG: hypothetical protein ACI4LH_02160 [Candidatus Heritagella sp.]
MAGGPAAFSIQKKVEKKKAHHRGFASIRGKIGKKSEKNRKILKKSRKIAAFLLFFCHFPKICENTLTLGGKEFIVISLRLHLIDKEFRYYAPLEKAAGFPAVF